MSKDKSKTGTKNVRRSRSPRFPGDEKFADFGTRRRRRPVDGTSQVLPSNIGIISLGGRFDPADLEAYMTKHRLPTPTQTLVVVDMQPRFSSAGSDLPVGFGAFSIEELLDHVGADYRHVAFVGAAHDGAVHDADAWGSAPDSDPAADARLILDQVRS